MIRVTVRGETGSLSSWARRVGVSRQALWAQVYYRGKTPEKAVEDYLAKVREEVPMSKDERIDQLERMMRRVWPLVREAGSSPAATNSQTRLMNEFQAVMEGWND